MALITKDDVKNWMQNQGMAAADDTWLDANIPRIQALAETYCSRKFERQADIIEYQDGKGSETLFLDRYPIESVSQLFDDADRDFGDGSLIDADDFVIYSDRGMIKLIGFVFADSVQNVKVKYTGGYGSGQGQIAVPEDLKLALIKHAAADWMEARGAVNNLEGDEIRTKPYYLRKQANEILDRYIRFV